MQWPYDAGHRASAFDNHARRLHPCGRERNGRRIRPPQRTATQGRPLRIVLPAAVQGAIATARSGRGDCSLIHRLIILQMNTPGGNQCYGPIFEFLNPEAVAPGLVGAISLLVALYALALVPINYDASANIDVDQLQRRGAATKNRRRGQPTPGIVLCAVIVILLIYNSMH